MAPTKWKTVAGQSALKALVLTGPNDVSASTNRGKDHGIQRSELPSTKLALVLREAIRGKGEIQLATPTKLYGREKLDLLVEDRLEKSKMSVTSPFNVQTALDISESQFSASLDEINNLKDPHLFSDVIEEEIQCRNIPQPYTATLIASIISSRIHNAHLLASAWKLVCEILFSLKNAGLQDGGKTATHLRSDESLRKLYLSLFNVTNDIVSLMQDNFSALTTSSPHYAKYFRTVEDPNNATFDPDSLKAAGKSFIDSIVIELCFPRGNYPKADLLKILNEAAEEAPRHTRRFPEGLYDAIGDFSVAVELQQLIEAPLLQLDPVMRKDVPKNLPEYENWKEAQGISIRAADMSGNFSHLCHPLDKTRSKNVLGGIWKALNQNYQRVSGLDIDTLWGLREATQAQIPRWYAIPILHPLQDDQKQLVGGRKKQTLAITSDGDDTDDGMPPLQDVSDSEPEYSDLSSDEDWDDQYDDGASELSAYDTDEEEELKEMIRQANDTAHAGDWFNIDRDAATAVPDEDLLLEERKGNPFLKLLGSLRGRLINKSPKLKNTSPETRVADTKAPFAVKGTTESVPVDTTSKGLGESPLETPVSPAKKTTVQEVKDKDAVTTTTEKKKKPKKKKSTSAATSATQPISEVKTPPAAEVAPTPIAASPSKKDALAAQPKVTAQPIPTLPSTASLLSAQTSTATAQTGHSYIREHDLDVDAPKKREKVKTRPAQPTLFHSVKDDFRSKFKRDKDEDEKQKQKEPEADRKNWFTHLSKKSKQLMHRLLNTTEDKKQGLAGMRWDDFVKLMQDMGFKHNPSTAGSSVRFMPHDPRLEVKFSIVIIMVSSFFRLTLPGGDWQANNDPQTPSEFDNRPQEAQADQ